MKRGRKILFSILIIGLILIAFVVSSEEEKVGNAVYQELKKEGEVNVIIKTKEKQGFFSSSEEKLYGLKVDEKELKKLEKDNNIEEISFSPQISAFLQDSVSIVNATLTWDIKMNGLNITGIDETICIIDTALNFSHPNLQGKNLTCVIDCYNKECSEDCSVSDDNGHGTHVAGIAAASGKLDGVARQAGLISVKVLDQDGNAHSQNGTINLMDSIQWCVENKDNYNISVISLSLGTNTLYEGYCDSIFSSTLTKAINNATLYNISVIASTGNHGSTTGIASPACIQNSISVGAIMKDDSTFGYNRNNITDFVAPGYYINSTRGYFGGCLIGCSCSGEYTVCSGTSMAAPHVSGAFALVRQYLRLQNSREPTPNEIQDSLNNTAKIIYDSASNLNYSRIDIYSAIYSLDSSGPGVNLISPENQTTRFYQNVTFVCSANDVKLSNITLYIWNSSGIYNDSEFRNFGQINGRAEFNVSDIARDDYEWNCLSCDGDDNCSFAESNYTVKIDYNRVILNNPSDNSYVNHNETFNCSAETDSFKELSNLTLFIHNLTDNIYNKTINISGFTNSSNFYYNFSSEEEYKWNCLVYNNHSQSSFSISNYTINYDITSPNIILLEPLDSASYTGSQQVNFRFNVSEEHISNCSLILNRVVSSINNSVNASITQQFTRALSPGEYAWKIRCVDLASNEKNSSVYSLTINSDIVINSGGDGGVGTPTETTEETPQLNEEEPSDNTKSVEEPTNDENEQIVAFEEEPMESNLNTLSSRLIRIGRVIVVVMIILSIIILYILKIKNEKIKTKPQGKKEISISRRKRHK